MLNIVPVVEQILMLLCITAVGFYMRRKDVITDPVIKGVNSLLMRVAWPCMILMTTQRECTAETLSNFLMILVISLVILAVATIAAYAIIRKTAPKASASVFSILAIMPNAGFVGLPIVKAAYGDLGVFYLAAFLVGFNLVMWTICVFFFTGINLQSLRAALNPGFIASIAGTAFFLLNISLPTPLLSTVNQLGSLTTPLSMLLLGARLEQISPKIFRSKLLWCSNFIKLLAMPLLSYAIARLMNIPEMLTGVIVLSMAMPSAVAAQLFAEKYNDDIELGTTGVSVSTLLCIITIPIVLLIL